MRAARRRVRRSSAKAPLGLRDWIRFIALAGLVAAFIQFVRFANYVETGSGPAVTRPEAADAFLPLAGVASIKVWLATGWLDPIHLAAAVIVIATLVTAVLFRRALCSWLCPIGVLTEYLAKLGRRMFGRNIALPRVVDKALVALKYVGMFALMWWLLSTPTSDLRAFLTMPFYAVADMKLFTFYTHISAVVVLTVLMLLWLSVFVKSFWCRYLCPYGALQGLLGVLSPVTIVKDDARCTGCSRCTAVCINDVDVAGSRRSVTTAECMGCTNCVTACPRKGVLQLRLLGKWPVEPAVFGLAFVAVFLTVILGAVVTGRWTTSLPVDTYREIYKSSPGTTMPWSAQPAAKSGAPQSVTELGGLQR